MAINRFIDKNQNRVTVNGAIFRIAPYSRHRPDELRHALGKHPITSRATARERTGSWRSYNSVE